MNSTASKNWHAEQAALENGIKALGLTHTLNVDLLMDYLRFLAKWNRTYNLSAIRDPMEMVHLHLLDSLAILPVIKRYSEALGQNDLKWLDVGTGGGLPGVVMAICEPSWQWVLLDSAGKKTRFLQQCAMSLGLTNIEVIHGRAEDTQLSSQVDAVISRAFASLEDMIACTSHLLRPGGTFWAMKGQMPEHELSQVAKDYKVTQSHSINVPGVQAQRCLIALQPQSELEL